MSLGIGLPGDVYAGWVFWSVSMKGYKTYAGCILLGLTGIAQTLGLVSPEVAASIYSILGPLTGIALRHGVKKP